MKTTTGIFLLLAMVGCMATTSRGPAIRDRLSETSGLATHNISIDEESPGFISLNGNVSSDRDRDTIAKVARETRGVKELRNNLVVDSSSVAVSKGDDSLSYNQRGIRSEIISRMSSSQDLRDYRINVDAIGGAVTLRGEVNNERERMAAENIARNTRGVTSVRNEIDLEHSARSDFQISQNVREALRRRTDIDLSNVDIKTRDAIVTLSGSQNSNRDIDNLVSITRRVPSVRDVRNELTLANEIYADRYQN